MANYCVNTNPQANGDHEVHNLDVSCSFLPDPTNRLHLGNHQTCTTAVAAARRHYAKVNGCFYCARACHTG